MTPSHDQQAYEIACTIDAALALMRKENASYEEKEMVSGMLSCASVAAHRLCETIERRDGEKRDLGAAPN